MALSNTFPLYTATAGADLSSSQFTFVKGDSTAKQVVAAGAGGAAIGVLYEPAASGKDVGVAIGGIVTVYAGGTVSAGAKVMADSASKAVTATATNQVLGIARTAGASGALMEIYWQPQGILAA